MNRLDIYDGSDKQSTKIGEVYGNSNIKLIKSISSSGKSLLIDFKKQYMEGNQKTELEATIKYNKNTPECQTYLDVNENILMSPNDSNINTCSWLVTANFGSYIILNFKYIEVNIFILSITYENYSFIDDRLKMDLNISRFMKVVVSMQTL